MKVVITPNPYRDRTLSFALEAKKVLDRAGISSSVCLAFDVDRSFHFSVPDGLKLEDLQKELRTADILICFGGDGTLLHASKAAMRYHIPILGVNIGTMGFMAELEASEISQLSRLASGAYEIEERMMLSASVIREGEVLLQEVALNDAVITKGAVARVLQLDLFCDGVEAMSFSGDGVIICTPTGSTAYSMSAGGAIVEPAAENLIITPVCAHSMQARPIVTAGNRTISVQIGRTGKKNAFLSVDGGRAFRLNTGDIVRVCKSPHVTKLVKLNEKSFFEILNRKFS